MVGSENLYLCISSFLTLTTKVRFLLYSVFKMVSRKKLEKKEKEGKTTNWQAFAV